MLLQNNVLPQLRSTESVGPATLSQSRWFYLHAMKTDAGVGIVTPQPWDFLYFSDLQKQLPCQKERHKVEETIIAGASKKTKPSLSSGRRGGGFRESRSESRHVHRVHSVSSGEGKTSSQQHKTERLVFWNIKSCCDWNSGRGGQGERTHTHTNSSGFVCTCCNLCQLSAKTVNTTGSIAQKKWVKPYICFGFMLYYISIAIVHTHTHTASL